MDGFNELARIMIYLGLIIAALGALLYLFAGNLSWLGHLPGDIRIEKEDFTFYFPLTTMILLSIVINIIIKIISFFLKH